MQVYKDQVEGGLLSADSIVNEHGKTSRSALILEGPKYASLLRKRPGGDIRQLLNEDTTKRQNQEQLLSDFEMLTVNEDEFQLEELHSKQQSENPIVMTPGLHEFWEGFGSFPPYYFVRMEEVVFWQLIKKLLLDPKKRIVIVGSPGVGKSCFLMLVAFYLACVEKKKVLVIRRVKEKELESVVVLLDGQGSYTRVTNVPRSWLYKARAEAKGAVVLVDGYDQDALGASDGLEPFHVLATSCQYDAKHDDPSHVVVLPAWRRDDLLHYAKLTNWVVDTGLRMTTQLQPQTWPKLVKEQYFYNGGSLREFCKPLGEVKKRVIADCSVVGAAQAHELLNTYGGGQSRGQVDRIRRHYITDCNQEAHYCESKWWKLSVDSGYALSKLGRIISTETQLDIYKYAKSIGAGFLGTAYELLLHNAVHGAFAKSEPIVLKIPQRSEFDRIEICVQHVISSGESEQSCYDCLATLDKNTYWYPAYSFFPFIDAVTTCKAISSTSGHSDTILAYIQVTIQKHKKFKPDRLKRLNEEIDKTPQLKGLRRVFVVVGPDSDIGNTFTLRDAPDQDAFLSCFDRDQLEPQHQEEQHPPPPSEE